MVKILISQGFFGINEKQSDVKNQLKSWGAKDIIFNDDGIISAVMSENQFEEFINNLRNKVDGFLNDINNSYEQIKYIYHDNSYMNFNVIGRDFDDNIMKSINTDIYMAVAPYQVFSGIPQDEATVITDFRSRKNGKVIKTIDTHNNIKRLN